MVYRDRFSERVFKDLMIFTRQCNTIRAINAFVFSKDARKVKECHVSNLIERKITFERLEKPDDCLLLLPQLNVYYIDSMNKALWHFDSRYDNTDRFSNNYPMIYRIWDKDSFLADALLNERQYDAISYSIAAGIANYNDENDKHGYTLEDSKIINFKSDDRQLELAL